MIMLCPPGVYRPQRDTAVLAGAMERGGLARGRTVLDVGAGTGALAIAAARAGAASVTAIDLSMRSVLTTWTNSRLHRAGVKVRRGDLFEPARRGRYDLVLANPPYVPAATAVLPRHRIDRCWDGGPDGRAVLDRICAGVADVLSPSGTLLLVHSAVSGVETTIARLADGGLTAHVVERVRIPFGPVMRARAAMLELRGLVQHDETMEELVVVEASRDGVAA
ncbi:HemK2/MTQ2 family protein methyltransferase [Pseudonocardia sp. TRM90224]|uniref:HemK2/MTQ2 family protein methyltransferase n=1 Tax=Pseudonocardia sp. TRM90224 TaxID=2812678 RepID=UPI001E589B6C|nr:HemK2/MTQ2 family protein methyltransferase [Pseudonocardia sp. TRM90224]